MSAAKLVAAIDHGTTSTRCILFARDGKHDVITQHRARGGRAVFENDGVIILAEGQSESPLVPLARVPLTRRGTVGFQVENVLAATAAACRFFWPQLRHIDLFNSPGAAPEELARWRDCPDCDIAQHAEYQYARQVLPAPET